jgi:hypothetical protein
MPPEDCKEHPSAFPHGITGNHMLMMDMNNPNADIISHGANPHLDDGTPWTLL